MYNWSRATVVGASLSSTVTNAKSIEEFPFTSVTVNATVFVPISSQSNDVISKL